MGLTTIDDLSSRLLIMYSLIVAGIAIRLLFRHIDGLVKVLSSLLNYVMVPAVVFFSTVQFIAALIDLKIILFSASIFFFSSIVAYTFLKVLRLKPTEAGPFILNSLNPNEIYLALPIVYALYGSVGLGYSTVFLMVYNILGAFYFIPLYAYYANMSLDRGIIITGLLLFPPFISQILGLIFLGLGLTLPQLAVQPAAYISQATTYLALVFIGLNLKLKGNTWLSKPVLTVSAIRLIIIPLIMFGLLRYASLNEVWCAIIIIHAGMPPAVNNIIYTFHYNLDIKLTATIVAESTFLTLFTLPIIMFLGRAL
jgi:predicted permease